MITAKGKIFLTGIGLVATIFALTITLTFLALIGSNYDYVK